MRSYSFACLALLAASVAPCALADDKDVSQTAGTKSAYVRQSAGVRQTGVAQKAADVRQSAGVRQTEYKAAEVRQTGVAQKAADVRQGAGVRQSAGVRQYGGSKSANVRQTDVRQTDVRQVDVTGGVQPSPSGAVAGAAVNTGNMLLEFYRGQTDEVNMLTAQADKFKALNWPNAEAICRQLADDHRRLADQATGILRASYSIEATPSPTPHEPFISDDPIAMVDHDIQMHQDKLAKAQANLRLVTQPEVQTLLQTAIQGTENHIRLLQQLRADIQAGRREASLRRHGTLSLRGASNSRRNRR